MTKQACAFIVFIAAVLMSSGCSKVPGADDKVLVKVSNSFITVGDFKSRIAKLPAYYRKIAENNKKRYLEEMIAEKLFYEEALRKGINNDKEVAEIVSEAKRKIVITKLIKNEVDDKVAVSEAEIRAFYDANKDKMKTPAMWRASHILVPTEQEAGDMLLQLNGGASFEELARTKSKDATATRGGDVGFFRSGQLVPEFEKAATKLNVGQTSDIVQTKFGYHVIKLTDKKGNDLQPYEKARPLIESELMKKKRAEMFYELIMTLKKKYGVNIDESAFAENDPSANTEKPQGKKI